jgi:putative hydrolase of HD superfamily
VSWYNKDNEEGKAAVGIDIPEKSFWGRGLGMQALELWIAYLFSVMQIDCVYTETWSGNTRMTRLAEKLGFEEVEREISKRDVRGQLYDGLAFILTKDRFIENRGDLMAYCIALNSD